MKKARERKMLKMVLLFGALLAAVTFAAPFALPSAGQDGKASAKESSDGKQYSGTYTFLQEGEYVAITVEDGGLVAGYISRFDEKERNSFADQFFKSGKLEGDKLSFTTKPLHDVTYEFIGTVARGEGKNPGDEAYFVLTGTLSEITSGPDKKTSVKKQEVNFRRFPDESPDDKN